MFVRPLLGQLDRYLFRQTLLALVAVTGGLAALIWLTQSLHFVELVVNHGLSLLVFLELTGLLVPSFVAVILPITCFVVVQFIYQRLAGDRELTVMRAAGLSPLALSRPALAVAALALVSCYALNLWLVPISLERFREYQWEIRNKIAAFLLQEGVFTPVSDDLTVYVRAREPDGTLHGILVDDARQKNDHATIIAERGRMIAGPTGPRVLLESGSREQIDHDTGRLDLLTFSENTIDLTSESKSDVDRVRDMSEVSLRELLHPEGVVANARDIPKWRAEGHRRLSAPITTVSFTLIALVSVLSGAFRRHGGLMRPLVAIGTVVFLLATGLVIGNLAARNNVLIPAMYFGAVGPGLVAAWFLFGPRVSLARPEPRLA